MHLDRRLAWRKHTCNKRKQLDRRTCFRGGPIVTELGLDNGIPEKSRETLKYYRHKNRATNLVARERDWNSSLVPAFNSASGTVLDFDSGHAFDYDPD
ncbi:hypothetical protein EVAR_20269_1 [Eumeta japonica]|uniref:Uncharacterized protein n=1 Tax=Eumeta variegata TaxID=151549 RepID=A0A4C1VLY3_EUMVA|nr:hypothetical protein EVAR_20269_1 [Eumeta japonica]